MIAPVLLSLICVRKKKTKAPRAATRMLVHWRQGTEYGSKFHCPPLIPSGQFPAATAEEILGGIADAEKTHKERKSNSTTFLYDAGNETFEDGENL